MIIHVRIFIKIPKMRPMNVCFSMSTHPPGVVIWPSMYNEDLQVCHSVIDPLRTSTIMVIGVSANAGAMILIWFSRKQEQEPGSYNIPNVLVLVLCATDLSWLLCGESVWLASVLFGSWLGGPAAYLYSTFVSTTCLRLSGCVVILMGVERYLSLLKPFYYDNKVTIQRIFLSIFILMLFSLAMSSFQLIGELNTVTNACNMTDTSYCFVKDDASVSWTSRVYAVYDFISVIESVINVVVLMFCNVFVIRCMRQMRRRIELVCPRSRDEYMKQVDMIKGVSAEFSRLLVAITLVFLITIIPYEVRVLCNHFKVWFSPTIDYIASVLFLSNMTINPLMYVLFRRKYRRKMWRKVVKLVTSCRRINRVRPHIASPGKDDEQGGEAIASDES